MNSLQQGIRSDISTTKIRSYKHLLRFPKCSTKLKIIRDISKVKPTFTWNKTKILKFDPHTEKIKFHWIPARVRIEGNELADLKAKKKSTAQNFGKYTGIPFSDYMTHFKARKKLITFFAIETESATTGKEFFEFFYNLVRK